VEFPGRDFQKSPRRDIVQEPGCIKDAGICRDLQKIVGEGKKRGGGQPRRSGRRMEKVYSRR